MPIVLMKTDVMPEAAKANLEQLKSYSKSTLKSHKLKLAKRRKEAQKFNAELEKRIAKSMALIDSSPELSKAEKKKLKEDTYKKLSALRLTNIDITKPMESSSVGKAIETIATPIRAAARGAIEATPILSQVVTDLGTSHSPAAPTASKTEHIFEAGGSFIPIGFTAGLIGKGINMATKLPLGIKTISALNKAVKAKELLQAAGKGITAYAEWGGADLASNAFKKNYKLDEALKSGKTGAAITIYNKAINTLVPGNSMAKWAFKAGGLAALDILKHIKENNENYSLNRKDWHDLTFKLVQDLMLTKDPAALKGKFADSVEKVMKTNVIPGIKSKVKSFVGEEAGGGNPATGLKAVVGGTKKVVKAITKPVTEPIVKHVLAPIAVKAHTNKLYSIPTELSIKTLKDAGVELPDIQTKGWNVLLRFFKSPQWDKRAGLKNLKDILRSAELTKSMNKNFIVGMLKPYTELAPDLKKALDEVVFPEEAKEVHLEATRKAKEAALNPKDRAALEARRKTNPRPKANQEPFKARVKDILTKKGFTEDEITRIMRARDAVSFAINKTSSKLLENFKKTLGEEHPIVKAFEKQSKNFIVPLTRKMEGKTLVVTATDRSGKTILFKPVKNLAEAAKVKASVLSGETKVGRKGTLRAYGKGIDKDIKTRVLTPKELNLNNASVFEALNEAHRATASTLEKMRGSKGMPNEAAAKVAKALNDKFEKELNKRSNLGQHLLKQDMVAGFTPDDVDYAIRAFINNAYNKIEKNTLSFAADGIIKELRKANVDKHTLNDAIRILHDMIDPSDPSLGAKALNLVSGITATMYIGFKVSTALVNAMSALTNTLESSGYLSDSTASATAETVKALKDIILYDEFHVGGKGKGRAEALKNSPLTPDEIIMLDHARNFGLTETSFTDQFKEFMSQGKESKINKLVNAAFFLMEKTERPVRGTTYLAMYRMLKKTSVGKDVDFFNKVEEQARGGGIPSDALIGRLSKNPDFAKETVTAAKNLIDYYKKHTDLSLTAEELKKLEDSINYLESNHEANPTLEAHVIGAITNEMSTITAKAMSELVKKSHGEYGKKARILGERGNGVSGAGLRAVTLLQHYIMNKVNMYADLLSRKDTNKAALLKAAAVYFLIGGVGGMPFVAQGVKGYDWLKKKLTWSNVQTPSALNTWLKKRNMWTRGVATALGVDLSGASALNFPTMPGVNFALYDNIKQGARYFERGQYSRGLERMLPSVAANPLTAARKYVEGETTSHGKQLLLGGKPVNQYTFKQAVLKALGFNPVTANSEELDKYYTVRNIMWQANKYRSDALSEAIKDLNAGNTEHAKAVVKKYNDDLRKIYNRLKEAYPKLGELRLIRKITRKQLIQKG